MRTELSSDTGRKSKAGFSRPARPAFVSVASVGHGATEGQSQSVSQSSDGSRCHAIHPQASLDILFRKPWIPEICLVFPSSPVGFLALRGEEGPISWRADHPDAASTSKRVLRWRVYSSLSPCGALYAWFVVLSAWLRCARPRHSGNVLDDIFLRFVRCAHSIISEFY